MITKVAEINKKDPKITRCTHILVTLSLTWADIDLITLRIDSRARITSTVDNPSTTRVLVNVPRP